MRGAAVMVVRGRVLVHGWWRAVKGVAQPLQPERVQEAGRGGGANFAPPPPRRPVY